MVKQNLKKKSLILLLHLKWKKFRKRKKMHLPIIWIERIPLLQVYFSYFIAKQSTIFKDICIKEGTKFCSACFSSGLIYHGPANWSCRRQMPRANYYYYITWRFLYFFLNQFFQKIVSFFFSFLHKKIRSHLVKGVLL